MTLACEERIAIIIHWNKNNKKERIHWNKNHNFEIQSGLVS